MLRLHGYEYLLSPRAWIGNDLYSGDQKALERKRREGGGEGRDAGSGCWERWSKLGISGHSQDPGLLSALSWEAGKELDDEPLR